MVYKATDRKSNKGGNLMFLSFQVVVIAHVTAGMVNLTRHEKEKYFLTATGEKQLFPSLHDPHSRELSVVIPAYNEELRSESEWGGYCKIC